MTAADSIAAMQPPVAGAKGTAIVVRDLVKRYGKLDAVRGINLQITDGEIFGLIGPDGAGKTSTFQILAGVMEATSGTADVFGVPARQARSHLSAPVRGSRWLAPQALLKKRRSAHRLPQGRPSNSTFIYPYGIGPQSMRASLSCKRPALRPTISG